MSEHIRIYIPVTAQDLAGLRDERMLRTDGARQVYAVTDAVQASDPSGDQESWEYAALQDAAAAAASAGTPVVVAAADVPAALIDAASVGSTGSRMRLLGEVPLPRVASLHVGDDVLSGAAVEPDHPGPGIELSWYDTTELDHVIALL